MCVCMQAPHSGRAGSRAEEQDAQVQEVAGGGNTGGELALWRFKHFPMVVQMTCATLLTHELFACFSQEEEQLQGFLDCSDIWTCVTFEFPVMSPVAAQHPSALETCGPKQVISCNDVLQGCVG